MKKGALWQRLNYYCGLFRRYWNVRQTAWQHCGATRDLVDWVAPYIGPLDGKRMLEIGCGFYYPISLLLHSSGYDVVASDKEYIGANVAFPVKLWQLWRRGGLEPLTRHIVFDAFIGWRLRREMQKLWRHPLHSKGLQVLTVDAERMDFSDESFDVIVSQATFEHLENVPQVVSEIARVLKKGGILYTAIQLFPSLSGGHRPDYKNYPWAHLRGKQLPTTYYLNRLRKRDYITIIGEKLEIVEVKDNLSLREGEELLTPEIRAELSDYSEEDLLVPFTAIIAQKPL